jgi:non-heme Fe2+,alpha-ketoglutarate-dependent halogenase
MTDRVFAVNESIPNAMLTDAQQRRYSEEGYYFPVRVFDTAETTEFRDHFLDYFTQNRQRLTELPPNEHYKVYVGTHLMLNWVYRMISHPNVLNVVKSVLGPNLIVWNTQWFAKMPGDKTYVSWHQDATYWGLNPPHVTTAWIALSECNSENGCMRVVPGTHHGSLLPQIDTYAPDNALSRGQEIAVDVDESKGVDFLLQAGEMSLHHIGIVHGSAVNRSNTARIGCAVRFISSEVVQEGTERQIGLLVHGSDQFGHFDLIDPPKDDTVSPEDNAIYQEAMRRMRSNLVPKKSS